MPRPLRCARRAPKRWSFRQQALAAFTVKLETVYDNGETIYDGASLPRWHGRARRRPGRRIALLVGSAAIRADREYIYGILKDGTPGAAMPYFPYDKEKGWTKVLDTLSRRFPCSRPRRNPRMSLTWEASDGLEETCSVCHHRTARAHFFGRTLRPERDPCAASPDA